ncbi:MAG: hypothetical protein Q7S56_02800 [Nanoarchaeota archaeon]|nr:hypothetical protein [Nanoarchaeota archaeon]
MAEKINFKNMRKELIQLYEEFLKNPSDESIRRKVIKYELDFGGLSLYNDYLKSQPVPKDIENALSGLSTIYQYGWWKDTNKADAHEVFSNENLITLAKRILEDLKKSK